MRSATAKAGSGRVVVALLGLLFMKALGDVLVAPGSSRGRSAEALEPEREIIEAEPAAPAALRSAPNRNGADPKRQ